MEASKIIAAAREYVGTPFHHQGRQKGIGIDCAGLVECVARDVGYDVPIYNGYGREPYKGQLEAVLAQHLIVGEITPGCVLLFKFPNAPAMHIGIYTGSTIIHAWSQPGKCVEHDYDKKWQQRTVRAYQWPIQ